MSEKVCNGCGQVHRPGVLVECVGGPRDGERHDYALGDPDPTPNGRYVLDRTYGERQGGKRQYAYLWTSTPEADRAG